MTMNKSLSIKLDKIKEVHLLIALFVSVILFISGIIMPIFTISKMVVIKNHVSVLSGVWDLLQDGQYFLFLIITIFSIVFPIIKIYILYLILSPWHKTAKSIKLYLKFMHEYGRWAMLDVFVVAVILVSVKLKALAKVEIHLGLYLFTISILLNIVITHLTIKLIKNKKSVSV